MSSVKKTTKLPPPREDNASPTNGEQDQGVSFKGPSPSEDSSAVQTPELESSESPKSPMTSALRRDSFKDIGQRRRSSESNQSPVNLRRAQGYSKDNEMARNVGA